MGQGIINISAVVFEKQVHQASDGFVETGDPSKLPQTLEEWHTFLMLPEEYHVIGASTSASSLYGGVWRVLVENEAIPEMKRSDPLDVTAIYVREYDQKSGTSTNHLDRIELSSGHSVLWQRAKEQAK